MKGELPDNKNILTLFDSGASKTIISENFVKSSIYLSRLPKTKVSPIRFRLGNGQFMTADSVIKFEMHMQGHKFQISALIVDNLVGVDLIRGTNTLAELDGTLNFKEHTFKLKPKKISFAPTNKVVLNPGETKYITLQGKTPSCVKNSEVIINANKHLSKCCPSTKIVSLHRGRTKIAVTNTSDKPVHFSKGRPIAFLNLGQLVTFTQELPVDDDSDGNEI